MGEKVQDAVQDFGTIGIGIESLEGNTEIDNRARLRSAGKQAGVTHPGEIIGEAGVGQTISSTVNTVDHVRIFDVIDAP